MEVITTMKKKKTRLIDRKGNENIALKVEDIACIYRDNTIIIAVDKDEKKYLCDKHLSALEEDLEPSMFFRANRNDVRFELCNLFGEFIEVLAGRQCDYPQAAQMLYHFQCVTADRASRAED